MIVLSMLVSALLGVAIVSAVGLTWWSILLCLGVGVCVGALVGEL